MSTQPRLHVPTLANTREEFAAQLRDAIALDTIRRHKIDKERAACRANAGLVAQLRETSARRGTRGVIDWPEYFRNIGCVY